MFLEKFCGEQLARRRWRLQRQLRYLDRKHGLIHVPKGFVTDLASIDTLRALLPLLFATLVGYGNAAAALHDWLYSTRRISRRHADAVFYRALRSEGVARWRAAILWCGVRLFGWWRYRLRR